jgi:hypothetical protein
LYQEAPLLYKGLSELSEYDPTDPKWDSDEALESLKMERSVRGDLTNTDLTKKLLEEAGPQAAMSIIHIALHGTNENTRLNAAKYVTDNLIAEGGSGAGKQGWEALIGDTISEAEVHANTGSSSATDGDS